MTSDSRIPLESPNLMASSDIDATRGSLVRSASTITPLTLLSRVTGYLRDKVIAATLGAGTRTDAFFAAQNASIRSNSTAET